MPMIFFETRYMKRKAAHHKTHKKHISTKRTHHDNDRYVVFVRSWVFLVLFAIMLGVGVLAGNYIRAQLNGTPTVAGVTTER